MGLLYGDCFPMTDIIHIHPENPQNRFIRSVVACLEKGGVIIYPTDSGYSLGCLLSEKAPLNRIRRIRQLEKDHLLTLLCRDLSEVSHYARFSTPTFRILKTHLPGPYTFVLEASRVAKKTFCNPKRSTVGVRMPSHPVARCLLESAEVPLLGISLNGAEESLSLDSVEELDEDWLHEVDMIIDSGRSQCEPTSIIDLTSPIPVVLREGSGPIDIFT